MSLSKASFVGFVRLYSDKFAINRREKALIEYLVYAVLLQFSPRCHSRLMKSIPTVVEALPVGDVKVLKALQWMMLARFTGSLLALQLEWNLLVC